LHAVDLRANEWSDLVDLDLTLGQQVWERGVGVFAVVIVLKVLQRWISGRLLDMIFMGMRDGISQGIGIPFCFVIPDRQIFWVGYRRHLVCALDLDLFLNLVSNQVLLVVAAVRLQRKRNRRGAKAHCLSK
jgi:hypothetical protein